MLSYSATALRVCHTIATTSRRPLTTTFLGVVAGGCQRSANVCRWSPTSRRLVVRELHRQPLADLRQPLFLGGFRRFSVVGKWLSMFADQSTIGRRLVVRTVCRREVYFSPTKLVGEIVLNIVWSATVLRSIGDQPPTSLQWLPHHFFWLVTIRRLQKNKLPSAEQRRLL